MSDNGADVCGLGNVVRWAGGSNTGTGGTFAFPTYADTTQLEWAFWKKYAW